MEPSWYARQRARRAAERRAVAHHPVDWPGQVRADAARLLARLEPDPHAPDHRDRIDYYATRKRTA
jgi:hypothetical protein